METQSPKYCTGNVAMGGTDATIHDGRRPAAYSMGLRVRSRAAMTSVGRDRGRLVRRLARWRFAGVPRTHGLNKDRLLGSLKHVGVEQLGSSGDIWPVHVPKQKNRLSAGQTHCVVARAWVGGEEAASGTDWAGLRSGRKGWGGPEE